MSIVPGFAFQFCFEGEKSAKELASRAMTIVLFWKEGERFAAVPAQDRNVACFPMRDKEESHQIIRLAQMIGYGYGDKI